MENIIFGTIDIKQSYSIYTAPAVLSKEMMEKVLFSQENKTNSSQEDYSNLISETSLTIPKPSK